MLKRKWLVLILVTLMASLLSACGGDSKEPKSSAASSSAEPSSSASETTQKLDPVTLKIMIPGDRPANMDAIIAEAEKRMADTQNVKLDVTFVPWADLAQKTQV